MKLNGRYIRNIRENLSFYVSAIFLTVLSLTMFFLFNMAGCAILNFADEFFEEQKLEDAEFTTYLPIPEEEIAELEDAYHLTLEVQRYINIY